jgi:short-subunit dehydrogenase
MSDWLRDVFRDRPWWINALMVFCAYMAFVYVPWDLFVKPVAEDHEVWFGIAFTGWAAKVMAVPHWIVYAAGFHGFRRLRPWVRSWGAVYTGQIAFGMFVWSWVRVGGLLGFLAGGAVALPFVGLTWLLWNARDELSGARPRLRERYGEWALVTGASSGIGLAFARALAREGMSCVLTARREERLSELAAELEKDHQVSTRVVAADLGRPGGADALLEAVRDLEISVLVNNAGLGAAGRFDRVEGERLRELVHVNCLAPVALTHALLAGMRERGRGAVLFTGSIAGRQPLPLHGVYAASKAFDLFLGDALYVECRDAGVDVLVLEPGSTDTEFQSVAGEIAHGGASPVEVVRIALDALGAQPSVIPGWLDWLRANAAARLAPRRFVAYLARDVVAGQTPPERM